MSDIEIFPVVLHREKHSKTFLLSAKATHLNTAGGNKFHRYSGAEIMKCDTSHSVPYVWCSEKCLCPDTFYKNPLLHR